MTKAQMARAIVWQIKGLLDEPAEDHPMIESICRRNKKSWIALHYRRSQDILKERGLGYDD